MKNKFIIFYLAFILSGNVNAADLKELAEQLVNISAPKEVVVEYMKILEKQGISDDGRLKSLTESYFLTKEKNKKTMKKDDFKKELGSKLGYFLKRGWNEEEVIAQYVKYRQLGYSPNDSVLKTEKILNDMSSKNIVSNVGVKKGNLAINKTEHNAFVGKSQPSPAKLAIDREGTKEEKIKPQKIDNNNGDYVVSEDKDGKKRHGRAIYDNITLKKEDVDDDSQPEDDTPTSERKMNNKRALDVFISVITKADVKKIDGDFKKLENAIQLSTKKDKVVTLYGVKKEDNGYLGRGKQKAKLFGFINWESEIDVKFDDKGEVKKIYEPWYSFLLW